jgi:hypothetical protein
VKSIGIIVRTADTGRAAEALRAAVGMTLRFERVLLVAPPAVDDRGARALALLRELGQVTEVDVDAALAADVVEVWT